MKLVRSELAQKSGKKLIADLKIGAFKKNYRPNHGADYTRGFEEL